MSLADKILNSYYAEYFPSGAESNRIENEREKWASDPAYMNKFLSHVQRQWVPDEKAKKLAIGSPLEKVEMAIPEDDPRRGLGAEVHEEFMRSLPHAPSDWHPYEVAAAIYNRKLTEKLPDVFNYARKQDTSFGIGILGDKYKMTPEMKDVYEKWRKEEDKASPGILAGALGGLTSYFEGPRPALTAAAWGAGGMAAKEALARGAARPTAGAIMKFLGGRLAATPNPWAAIAGAALTIIPEFMAWDTALGGMKETEWYRARDKSIFTEGAEALTSADWWKTLALDAALGYASIKVGGKALSKAGNAYLETQYKQSELRHLEDMLGESTNAAITDPKIAKLMRAMESKNARDLGVSEYNALERMGNLGRLGVLADYAEMVGGEGVGVGRLGVARPGEEETRRILDLLSTGKETGMDVRQSVSVMAEQLRREVGVIDPKIDKALGKTKAALAEQEALKSVKDLDSLLEKINRGMPFKEALQEQRLAEEALDTHYPGMFGEAPKGSTLLAASRQSKKRLRELGYEDWEINQMDPNLARTLARSGESAELGRPVSDAAVEDLKKRLELDITAAENRAIERQARAQDIITREPELPVVAKEAPKELTPTQKAGLELFERSKLSLNAFSNIEKDFKEGRISKDVFDEYKRLQKEHVTSAKKTEGPQWQAVTDDVKQISGKVDLDNLVDQTTKADVVAAGEMASEAEKLMAERAATGVTPESRSRFKALLEQVKANRGKAGTVLALVGPGYVGLNQMLETDADAMTVFHGTSRMFKRFSKAFARTGTGGQSYGEGVYLSSSKDVGKWYADLVGEKSQTLVKKVEIGGKDFTKYFTDSEDAAADFLNNVTMEGRKGARKNLLSGLKEIHDFWSDEANLDAYNVGEVFGSHTARKKWVSRTKEMIDLLEGGAALDFRIGKGKKVLHEVELPDNLNLLDLDKSVSPDVAGTIAAGLERKFGTSKSGYKEATLDEYGRTVADMYKLKEQMKLVSEGKIIDPSHLELSADVLSPFTGDVIAKKGESITYAVKERFEKEGIETVPIKDRGNVRIDLPTGWTVQSTLQSLRGRQGASDLLRELGVHGNTYVGETSGVRNYVIFDEKLPKITKSEVLKSLAAATTLITGSELLGNTDLTGKPIREEDIQMAGIADRAVSKLVVDATKGLYKTIGEYANAWKEMRLMKPEINPENPYVPGLLQRPLQVSTDLDNIARRKRLPLGLGNVLSPYTQMQVFYGATKEGREMMVNPGVAMASTHTAAINNTEHLSEVAMNIFAAHPGLKSEARAVEKEMAELNKRYIEPHTIEGYSMSKIMLLDREIKSAEHHLKKKGLPADERATTEQMIVDMQLKRKVFTDRIEANKPLWESFDKEYMTKMDEMAQKYPTTRIALAVEDTPDFQYYPFLKGRLSKDELTTVARLKTLNNELAKYASDQNMPIIASRPYIHHAVHPGTDYGALKATLDKLAEEGGDEALRMAHFHHRAAKSYLMMPDVFYVYAKYLPDFSRRLAWNDFWQPGTRTGWEWHSKHPYVQNSEGLKTLWDNVKRNFDPVEISGIDKWSRRLYDFEIARLLAASPSVAFKHMIKLEANWSNFGIMGSARILPKSLEMLYNTRFARDAGVKSDYVTQAAKSFTNQGKMYQQILDYDLYDVPTTVWDKMIESWNNKGSFLIDTVERFDRGHSFLAASEMALKQGMTPQQAAYGIYDTILKTNFLSGPMNPRWLRDPKIRMMLMFQGTPFKILEQRAIQMWRAKKSGEEFVKLLGDLRNDIKEGEHNFKLNMLMDAIGREKDIFGTPVTSQLARKMLIVGTAIATGRMGFDADLWSHFSHPPMLKFQTSEFGIAANPLLQAAHQTYGQIKSPEADDEFWLSKFFKNWLKDGLIQSGFIKANRISKGDIPERYKDSRLKYVFGVPAIAD